MGGGKEAGTPGGPIPRQGRICALTAAHVVRGHSAVSVPTGRDVPPFVASTFPKLLLRRFIIARTPPAFDIKVMRSSAPWTLLRWRSQKGRRCV